MPIANETTRDDMWRLVGPAEYIELIQKKLTLPEILPYFSNQWAEIHAYIAEQLPELCNLTSEPPSEGGKSDG